VIYFTFDAPKIMVSSQADSGGGDLLRSVKSVLSERANKSQREGSSVVVKVLYIEDNDDDVYMLKMRLELLGNFEVLTAEDGEKGCEVAAAEQPDIILMDLEMPVVDGWEVARRLKGNPQTRVTRKWTRVCLSAPHLGSVYCSPSEF
jgi:PleD family two-component response regulator